MVSHSAFEFAILTVGSENLHGALHTARLFAFWIVNVR